MGVNPLPAMLKMARDQFDCTLVPACDSYFALSEACLGRQLAVSANGPRDVPLDITLTADERALLTALRHCPLPSEAVRMAPGIPHGLPGALCWAAYAVRRALGVQQASAAAMDHCPNDDAPDMRFSPVMPEMAAYPRPPIR